MNVDQQQPSDRRDGAVCRARKLRQVGARRSVRPPSSAMRGTSDPFTEVSRGVDKLLWKVEAHLQGKD